MTFKKFEESEIWQMGRELVKAVYAMTGSGAFAKDYGLKDQLYHARDLDYVNAEVFERLYNDANLIQVKLYHLIQSLSSTMERQKL